MSLPYKAFIALTCYKTLYHSTAIIADIKYLLHYSERSVITSDSHSNSYRSKQLQLSVYFDRFDILKNCIKIFCEKAFNI